MFRLLCRTTSMDERAPTWRDRRSVGMSGQEVRCEIGKLGLGGDAVRMVSLRVVVAHSHFLEAWKKNMLTDILCPCAFFFTPCSSPKQRCMGHTCFFDPSIQSGRDLDLSSESANILSGPRQGGIYRASIVYICALPLDDEPLRLASGKAGEAGEELYQSDINSPRICHFPSFVIDCSLLPCILPTRVHLSIRVARALLELLLYRT